MIASADITNFMNWWVGQCVRIFTFTFDILDNIQFNGTSILRVMVFILILGALTKVVLTIPNQVISITSERKGNKRKQTKGEKQNDTK